MDNKSVILPKWIDGLIFKVLSAKYSRRNKDLVVLEWEKDEVLTYLGISREVSRNRTAFS